MNSIQKKALIELTAWTKRLLANIVITSNKEIEKEVHKNFNYNKFEHKI